MSASARLEIDTAVLRPLIEEVVVEVLARVERDGGPFRDRLAVGEQEAARLLSLRQHQLRDLRLRKEISASRGPGNKIMYSREDLLAFLARRRVNGKS